MSIRELKEFLDLQKEGIFVGLIAALGIYFAPQIMAYLPKEPEWWRLAILIFIGTSIGAIVDSIYKPRK